MKKIWLFCLCLVSLSLAWCFHVPNEDWLPSKNKIESWSTQSDKEMEDAINSLTDWVNLIWTQWDEKNNEVIESENITVDENNETIIYETADLWIDSDILEE